MRFDPWSSREAVLAALRAEAAAAWGDARLEALQTQIEQTAGALWRIDQERLGPTDLEPEFVD